MPQTAYQKAEATLLAKFCKELGVNPKTCSQLSQLVGTGKWIAHFDALTHNQTEVKLRKLLRMVEGATFLEMKVRRMVEEHIQKELEANQRDKEEAEAWY